MDIVLTSCVVFESMIYILSVLDDRDDDTGQVERIMYLLLLKWLVVCLSFVTVIIENPLEKIII